MNTKTNRFDMNTWTARLNKAVRIAGDIERGAKIEERTDDTPTLVKHYRIYSVFGSKEKPIAWRLYAADVDQVMAAAQRRLLRNTEEAIEHNPLFTGTRFEVREEVW